LSVPCVNIQKEFADFQLVVILDETGHIITIISYDYWRATGVEDMQPFPKSQKDAGP
jgi:hypothetical protein